jgi:probable F420-dependent oxidoreductase
MLKVTVMVGRLDELPGGNQRQAIELAKMADDAGIYGIALGEHLVLGSRLDRYPYAGGLRHPEGARTSYLEPVAVLSAFAAVTSRIRLSTSILLSSLRPAILLAKQLATLDVLSEGRCEPVFGIGWQPEEYEAEGLDFSKRHQLFRDNIAACRALWGEQPASFSSDTVSFDGLHALPRPVQDRIPILCGITVNDRNAGLIAELCDGWDPAPDASKSPEQLRQGAEMLGEAFGKAGRDPKDLIVRAHLAPAWKDEGRIDLERSFEGVTLAQEAGATEFAFGLPVGYGKMLDSMADVQRMIADIGRIAEKY